VVLGFTCAKCRTSYRDTSVHECIPESICFPGVDSSIQNSRLGPSIASLELYVRIDDAEIEVRCRKKQLCENHD
jgi:hypothetical protein